jgi:hypothetical protein
LGVKDEQIFPSGAEHRGGQNRQRRAEQIEEGRTDRGGQNRQGRENRQRRTKQTEEDKTDRGG